MKHSRQVTLSQVQGALQELGGEAIWAVILAQVTKNRNGDYSYYLNWSNYERTTFQVMQTHCQDYKKLRGQAIFEKVWRGRFRLTGSVKPQLTHTPVASDIEESSHPERVKQETYRILRDTASDREVKQANNYRCQICSQVLRLKEGKSYAETHHIKPLGAPHNGPDVRGNVLCVCPNDHVLLDYGAIKLYAMESIDTNYINYHNEHIFGKA